MNDKKNHFLSLLCLLICNFVAKTGRMTYRGLTLLGHKYLVYVRSNNR